MKRSINWSLGGVLSAMLYGIGYGQGVRKESAASRRACERAMAPVCTAVSLVTLKQVTRLIEAKNRKPIVVECRR